ncbi:MAG: L-threonylcarbamoyladenylate synthase [Ignavibacteriaceae bacterium]|nr:L-threonylcarbamoyladenylate synthase [Ignavibacteriaceae bacterium]
MEFYELHPENPQLRYLNKAVDVLKSGGVIIFPTDTYYGLGCDLFNKEGIEQLFAIKHESDTKLFSFICADLKDISSYAKVSDFAYKSMKKLLPGPYTFILPAAKVVPKKLWDKRKTVGIRVPDHPITLKLIELLGNPIVSTSVSSRKGEALFDPFEIRNIFNSQVDLMLASGKLSHKPSSVVDLSGEEPRVIREGAGDTSIFT